MSTTPYDINVEEIKSHHGKKNYLISVKGLRESIPLNDGVKSREVVIRVTERGFLKVDSLNENSRYCLKCARRKDI